MAVQSAHAFRDARTTKPCFSNRMTRILILRDRPAAPMSYAIDHYAAHWKDAGHQIIDHIGLDNIPSADLVIVHIDLTVLPSAYIDMITKISRTINGQVFDISRRRFSRLLLSQTNRYAGPVIVKTNANYGGVPELDQKRQRDWKRKIRNWATRKSLNPLAYPIIKDLKLFYFEHTKARQAKSRKWGTIESLNPLDYPIFKDIESVPRDIWKNENLIVEPFIRNWEDGLFYVHYYVFFGDREVSGRIGSPNPVVKFRNSVVDEEFPVPDDVRQWREQFRIDFGRFDYLDVGGEYFLIDINKTEGGGNINYKYKEELEFLASGLDCYLA